MKALVSGFVVGGLFGYLLFQSAVRSPAWGGDGFGLRRHRACISSIWSMSMIDAVRDGPRGNEPSVIDGLKAV